MTVHSTLIQRIAKVQVESQDFVKYFDMANDKDNKDWKLHSDDTLRFRDRLWVPKETGLELRNEILNEAHRSHYTIHPGGTKMYRNLRRNFWWPGMKRSIAEFMKKCLTCQQVKAENKLPGGLLQPLPIPDWK